MYKVHRKYCRQQKNCFNNMKNPFLKLTDTEEFSIRLWSLCWAVGDRWLCWRLSRRLCWWVSLAGWVTTFLAFFSNSWVNCTVPIFCPSRTISVIVSTWRSYRKKVYLTFLIPKCFTIFTGENESLIATSFVGIY